MAIIESGTLGRMPSVTECLAHPSRPDMICDEWGIESPSIMIVGGKRIETPCVKPCVIGGVTFEIYRHPELLIPHTVALWRKTYNMEKKHNVRPEGVLYEEDFHPCYIEATEVYENFKGGINGK